MTEQMSLGVINTDMGAESTWRRRRRSLVAHLTNLFVLYDTVYIRTEDYLELAFLLDVFTASVIERLLEMGRLRFVFSPQFGLSRRSRDFHEGWDDPKNDYILENWVGVSWSTGLWNPWAEQYPEFWPPQDMDLSSHPAPRRLIDLARKTEIRGLTLDSVIQLARRVCIVSQPLFRPAGGTAIDAFNAELSIRGILNTRFEMLLDLALARKCDAQVACHYRQYALKPPHRFADLDHAPLSTREHGLASIRYLLGLPSAYTAIWAQRADPAQIARATFHKDAVHFRRWIAQHDAERLDQAYSREVSRLLFRNTTSLSQWVGWGVSSLIGTIPVVGGVAGAAVGAAANVLTQQKSPANIFVEGELQAAIRPTKDRSHRAALAKIARTGLPVRRRKPDMKLWTETTIDAPEDQQHLTDQQLARLYLFPYPPERDHPPFGDAVDPTSPLATRLQQVAEALQTDVRHRIENGTLTEEETGVLRQLLHAPLPVTAIRPILAREDTYGHGLKERFPGLQDIVRNVYKDEALCLEIQSLFRPVVQNLMREQ